MGFTLYGLLIAGICLLMLVLKRPLREFVMLLVVCGVFGAAEAMSLPMLGGASLTAPNFCVLFVIVKCLFIANRKPKLAASAIKANSYLLLAALYGLIVAFTMPRLLEGAMSVFAMRPQPFRTLLTFTSQNITQSVYLILTALASVAGYMMAQSPKGFSTLALGWTIAALLFILFGLVDLASFYAGAGDMLAWLKTANYAILSQSADGIRRISGSFPEPSSFAAFGAAPMILFAYMWLVDVKSTQSGLLALGVAILIGLSTSATGFATLGMLLLMILVAGVITPMPRLTRRRKFVVFAVMAAISVVAIIGVSAMMPAFADKFAKIFTSNTIDKRTSASAVERGIWAAQGWDAFLLSKGVGIGPGSFRSSGIAQAILGSMGVFGVICLLLYLGKIWRAITRRVRSPQRPRVIACGLTSLLILTPAFLVSASPDPGVIFGLMAGFVLGLDRRTRIEASLLAADARDEEDYYPDLPADTVAARDGAHETSRLSRA
ncbi:MAG: hypothetical protein ABWZ40_11945 [Caulobacterales bacterium]